MNRWRATENLSYAVIVQQLARRQPAALLVGGAGLAFVAKFPRQDGRVLTVHRTAHGVAAIGQHLHLRAHKCTEHQCGFISVIALFAHCNASLLLQVVLKWCQGHKISFGGVAKCCEPLQLPTFCRCAILAGVLPVILPGKMPPGWMHS